MLEPESTYDLNGVMHHPILEDIVDVLVNKVQNTDRSFFRIEVAYFLAKMAASMRATVHTKDRGSIPVNIYALALATSGYGKGHSVHIIEDQFLSLFKRRFVEETFPLKADENLWKLALGRAAMAGTDETKEKESLDKEFRTAGALAFTFDSGTAPAVKQLRHKLLLSNAGSINLQIDEIGSNLVGNVEILNVFLELYDQGIVKQKLVKNTNDNERGEEIEGKTPTNMLLFGTPTKLLDGSQTEEQFYSFLETGYARRCIFSWGHHKRINEDLTPTELYHRLIQPQNGQTINRLAQHFGLLADPVKFGWEMEVDDPVGIKLLTYRMDCERRARLYADHEDIRKAEMEHRYFKALKLAGTYAFIDESSQVEPHHLDSAILLIEESGKAFQRMMTREKAYVKLARYIAASDDELTHADLHEALPFYKSSQSARNEMMGLAMGWGFKNHVVIRKTFQDGIEFFSGETLRETDPNAIQVSYSDHFAYNYLCERVPFEKLHILTEKKGMNWSTHGYEMGHRSKEHIVPGFNMLAFDIDGTANMGMVHDLLKDYTFMTTTTKSHSPEAHRFRLLMPMNYELLLDDNDYKELMNGIADWLPFDVDRSAHQREKKFQSCSTGSYHLNQGELFDVLRFIPRTTKNESHRTQMTELESYDNLERWFAQRMAEGNRNNNMLRFAMALYDSGMPQMEIETRVLDFNAKLSSPLNQDEIKNTVFVSLGKRFLQA